MKRNNWKKWTLVLSGILAVGIAAGGALHVSAKENEVARIEENIYVDDIHVGGMTEAEALTKINEYVNGFMNAEFTFTVSDKSVTAKASDLGVSCVNTGIVKEAVNIGKTGNIIERYKNKKDLEHENLRFELDFTADEATVKSFLEANTTDMNQEAKNYGLKRENGEFIITEGATGIAVDAATSAKNFVAYIENDWDGMGSSMELVAEVVEPEASYEQLAKVQDLLGTFTTDFSTSSVARATNVANAASKINGSVVYPGEILSVYEKINPFNAENGYELAGSYENGTTVSTYGGGVCQVSSTMYNAVIRAEVGIEERFGHSMIVAYVKPSMDAAIAGTYKDLKIRNDFDTPIYVEAYTVGRKLTFNIFGEETRPANRTIEFISETLSTTDPEPKFVESDAFPIGYVNVDQSAHQGSVNRLWKVVKIDGVEQSREVFNNTTYSASPRILTIGTASDDKDAVAAIKEAIKTKDEATIKAAAEANSAEALAEKEKEDDKKSDKNDKDKDKENNNQETTEPDVETEIPEEEIIPVVPEEEV